MQKRIIIILTFSVLVVIAFGFLYINTKSITYASTEYNYAVKLPRTFAQDSTSKPNNVMFTKKSLLPINEMTPTIQLLIADMLDTSVSPPKVINELNEYISKNEIVSFGASPSHQRKEVNGLAIETYCRIQGLRSCITFAQLADKSKVLKIILNYPAQGKYSGGNDAEMENAFMKASNSISLLK